MSFFRKTFKATGPKTPKVFQSLRVQPNEVIYDCQNNLISIGVKVAYNRSGNVVPGQVTGIFPKWRTVTWHPGRQWIGYFLVKNDLDNRESKVKRCESMMVI